MPAASEPITLAPPLPRFAQIEPVGRCNLACRMCTVNERGDEVAEMTLEQFRAILDQLPDLRELHLQGLGEPMLHPAFFDMVEFAAGRGIRVSANTNLTLLTPARAHRCVNSGLASLSVSLDGASAQVYEAIRRRASFAKVMRNLGRLVDARDAAGSALAVRGVMVLMRSNLDELPALVRLLHGYRVDELLVQRLSSDLEYEPMPARYIPIRDYVTNAELRTPDIEHAEDVFAGARALAARLGFRLHLPRLRQPAPVPRDEALHSDSGSRSGLDSGSDTRSEATGLRCRWPWDQLYLTAAGQMLPCCMVATADRATFGKVLTDDRNGVTARWHGDAAQAFRAALASDSPPEVCKSCALYHGTF